MDVMAFMGTLGESNLPLVAAFFIGLMTAISPCPLATNITAIAYMSKKIEKRTTIIVGLLYTLGRMLTYVVLASLIVYVGINTQAISFFLQKYGEQFIGPFLILIGVLMLSAHKFNFFKGSSRMEKLKQTLSEKGYLGCFLLGVVFALAFCPFSAVLFFGMLIPLALQTGDAIAVPAVFAIATGLPVIIFSFILVYSVSKIGTMLNKLQLFEKYMRIAVSIIFILIGLYYTYNIWI
ncbi:MAG: aromatic aminobenezylarsenical efflux permease ArsG family transporter [Candidatus Diapherotrites archaeon]